MEFNDGIGLEENDRCESIGFKNGFEFKDGSGFGVSKLYENVEFKDGSGFEGAYEGNNISDTLTVRAMTAAVLLGKNISISSLSNN